MANYCDDCGTRTSGGMCPNCQETAFIADQHRELGTYHQTSAAFRKQEDLDLQKKITTHSRKDIFEE